MGSAQRYAAGRAAECYPLAIAGATTWQPGLRANQWRTEINLEHLQPGELVVPSLALLIDTHYAVQCRLVLGDKVWPLTAINTNNAISPAQTLGLFTGVSSVALSGATAQAAITTHIDLFCVHQPIRQAQLVVELVSQSPPEDYLLVVSRRPQQLDATSLATPPANPRPAVTVPGLSQMVQPSAKRTRTCSPTALSMLMSHYGSAYHPAFVDQCREPTSSQYGVWPLNIMQASRRGFVGAVELVSDWQALATTQAPFVASIRFDQQQLDGAPLAATPGHLVLVRGTTNQHVLCNDPAAPSAESVARQYDFAQFSRAWLEFRGATYIVVPALGR